jgi:hypothetical protein
MLLMQTMRVPLNLLSEINASVKVMLTSYTKNATEKCHVWLFVPPKGNTNTEVAFLLLEPGYRLVS